MELAMSITSIFNILLSPNWHQFFLIYAIKEEQKQMNIYCVIW